MTSIATVLTRSTVIIEIIITVLLIIKITTKNNINQ